MLRHLGLFGLSVLVAAGQPLLASTGDAENLISNPGFEAGQSDWLFNSRPYNASLDVVADSTAPEGEMVASVTVGEYCRSASIGSRWITLEADQDYTLSVSLRSQKGDVPVTLSVWSWADANGGWNKKTESRKTVQVTEQWQRFFLQAKLQDAREGKYQVLIEVEQPAVIYADAVMLTQGDSSADFHAGSDLDFGIDFSEPSMLFEHGEPVDIIVRANNRRDHIWPLTLEYRVEDFRGDAVIIATKDMAAEPGINQEALRFELGKKGYYKLKISAIDSDGTPVGEQLASFALIEKKQSDELDNNSPFGVSLSPNRLELELERAKEIGVGHIRVHEVFGWKQVEPKEGDYEWESFDVETSGDSSSAFYKPADYDFSVYRQSGLLPLVYIEGYDKNRPDWADEYDREKQLSLYGDFYRELASHYRGVFEDFEVVNEPWGHMDAKEYLDILKAVYAKAKEGNPNARMVGVTAYHGPQINFLKETIDQGGLDYMDVISLHPYPRPDAPESVLIDFIQQTREWMENAGKTIPIWITEIGWTTQGLEPLPTRIPRPAHRNNSDTLQAQYMARAMIVSIANGVEKVDWFHFSGDHTFRYSYHMFEADAFSSPMKTVPVFSALSSILADAEFERKLAEGEGSLYAYLFSNGNRRIIPVWTTCKYSTLVLETGAGQIDVYDIMGNKIQSLQSGGGDFEIEVTGSVIYLIADASVLDSAKVKVPLEIRIEPAEGTNNYTLHVEISNVWDQPMKANLELILPRGVSTTEPARQPLKVEAFTTRKLALPLTVNSTDESLTGYVTVAVQAVPFSVAYVFEAREQLRHVKPLPKPESGIWIEAENPSHISFEPAPAWLPNQFRSYGGDNLRFRAIREVNEDDGNIVEYDFAVTDAGDYTVMLAASAFAEAGEADGLPTISWKMDDGPWTSCDESQEVGQPWTYSTHESIWWRFKNIWHDMGSAYLTEGEHRLMLKLGTPAKSDYGYLTIDAISILDQNQKQLFMNALQE